MTGRLLVSFLVFAAVVAPARGQALLQIWRGGVGDRIGGAIAVLDDLDGDGVFEVAATDAQHRLRVFSGLDGALLLSLSPPVPGECFATALRVVGDVDLDGRRDLLVGTPGICSGGPGHVQMRSGADLSLIWARSGAFGGDRYGSALASAGDVDLDGIEDLLVGAPNAQGSGVNVGMVEVLSGATGTPLWSLWGQASNDGFGSALGRVEDWDGDGIPEHLVGAPGGNSSPVGGLAGTGYVRVHSGATGAVLATILGAQPGDAFGSAVAGLEDLDGDGLADLAVGAPYSDQGASNGGLLRMALAPAGATFLEYASPFANDRLGERLLAPGDVDGDGLGDLLVGAPQSSSAAPGGGVVLLLSPHAALPIWRIEGGTPAAALGAGSAEAGDLDGDGSREVIVGAPGGPALGGPSALSGELRLLGRAPLLGPAAASRVLDAAGLPVDVLLVDGQPGGPGRRIELAVGQPFTLDVAQPPSMPGPAPFLICGALAAPLLRDRTPLPGGLGDLAFPPCPLLPGFEPLLFVLASSLGPSGCAELESAGPAPWSFPTPQGVPLPLDVALQGIVEAAPGQLAVTNGLLLQVR